jgi:general secretion pathway protein D
VLQNPQIRVLNNEKATLRIGDRVPIATGSFQPGIIGGGGVSPLVSTQFKCLDVGVNIDITPHIHSDREVTQRCHWRYLP